MIIVVTGATSFIGREYVKLAVECGNKVYAICRNLEKAQSCLPLAENLTLIEASMDSYSTLVNKIPSADVLLHFAWAGTKNTERELHDVHRLNVEYTIQTMMAAKQMGCQLFVDMGSQAEYGVLNEVIKENSPCHPFSEYGKAKLDVYKKGKEFCEEIGMKYLHLRIFSVFGENDHPHTLVMSGLRKLLDNETFDLSECTQKWNFLYIRDAVQQINRLCESIFKDDTFVSDVFNIASEDTRILKDFVEEMKSILQSESVLSFGAITPAHLVSLDPDVSKVKDRIGFIANYTFSEVIRYIADKIKATEQSDGGGNNCIVCGSKLDTALMKFASMPSSAQNIPTKSELSEDRSIKLDFCQCPCCGLVQLATTPVSYYKTVIRSGGISSTMHKLRKDKYQYFYEKYHLKGKKLLEVGCGRGEFLKIWNEGFDIRAVGIEYGLELVKTARNEGLEVYKGFAESADTELPEAPYDAFVQFNFLEHQPNPNKMLQCLYRNTTAGAVGMVTVPSLEYILKYNGYYELIRDHIAYYSIETLKLLFEKNGFEVLENEIINRDTHSVIVRKRPRIDVSLWKDNFVSLTNEINTLFSLYSKKGEKVAVWGASHQGFTLLASMNLSDKVAYVIDSAPFKQGKYSPGSHIPIVDKSYFKEESVSAILIVAPGYTDEIAHIIKTELSSDIHIYTLRTNHIEKIS